MSQPTIPRIAVVGGGIAGTISSLVLKNRGLAPILIDPTLDRRKKKDDAAGLGGRMRGGGTGVQFLRATDPRLQAVMGMLVNANVMAPWKGRFGMLGSQGGGFLPAHFVTSGMGSSVPGGGIAGLAPADPQAAAQTTASSGATDNGDFCNFVHSSNNPTYVGVPSMTDVCPAIANLANLSTMSGTELIGATMASEGGWLLELKESNETMVQQHFDALVLATHNPSLAGTIVQTIVNAELEAGSFASVEDAVAHQQQQQTSSEGSNGTLPLVLKRLSKLSSHLHQVRDEGRQPLYAIKATFPPGFSESVPFDAVSIPGSPFLQFLANEGSKPGRKTSAPDGGDIWTGISTSQLATRVLEDVTMENDDEKREYIQRVLSGEMTQLMSPYFDNDASKVPLPTSVFVKRWGAAICGKGLELQEDSITLASWRLGICGDFIRQRSAYPMPWEAAALSGLEAGERMASLFLQAPKEQS